MEVRKRRKGVDRTKRLTTPPLMRTNPPPASIDTMVTHQYWTSPPVAMSSAPGICQWAAQKAVPHDVELVTTARQDATPLLHCSSQLPQEHDALERDPHLRQYGRFHRSAISSVSLKTSDAESLLLSLSRMNITEKRLKVIENQLETISTANSKMDILQADVLPERKMLQQKLE